jgi:DNA-binding transcriptional LysR family regulator
MELEELAAQLSHGSETEINLVVEAAFPMDILINVLKQFAPINKGTRVQLKEVVLSGADEALHSGQADIVISHRLPPDYLANPLLEVEFVAVAHPQHALHRYKRRLTADDLSREMQVVIRDSGLKQNIDGGWLGAEHRWTVTSIGSAAAVIRAGLGFAWLPRHLIQTQLDNGELQVLPLSEGQIFRVMLYLIYGKPKSIGPATRQLADIFFANTQCCTPAQCDTQVL